MGAVHIPIIDEDAFDDLVTAVQALAAPSATNVAVSSTGMHYVTASNAQGAISELDSELYSVSTNLAQKQDTLTFNSLTIPSNNYVTSANTSGIYIMRWGNISVLTGILRVTAATTNLDILNTAVAAEYRPKYTNQWISAQYYGDNSGCDVKITTDGNINVAIPSGSVNKDIKISGSWICNG